MKNTYILFQSAASHKTQLNMAKFNPKTKKTISLIYELSRIIADQQNTYNKLHGGEYETK